MGVAARLLAGLLLIASVREAMATTWKLYQNARYGTVAEFPADLFRPGRPPDNGDGQSFTTKDGAQLAIFAGFNIEDYTPATYESFLRGGDSDYHNVTYRAAGGNWLVLSGYRGDLIFYEKYLFAHRRDGDVIHGLVVTYRRGAKAVYDPIVVRMAQSLRPG
jgi:hypothetical protein